MTEFSAKKWLEYAEGYALDDMDKHAVRCLEHAIHQAKLEDKDITKEVERIRKIIQEKIKERKQKYG